MSNSPLGAPDDFIDASYHHCGEAPQEAVCGDIDRVIEVRERDDLACPSANYLRQSAVRTVSPIGGGVLRTMHQITRQRALLFFDVGSCFMRRHVVPHCQQTNRSHFGGPEASTPPISSRCGRTSADAPTNAAQCVQIIIASDDAPYRRRPCVAFGWGEPFPVRVTSAASKLGKQSLRTQFGALTEQHVVRLDCCGLAVELPATNAHGAPSSLILRERLATGRWSRRGSSTRSLAINVSVVQPALPHKNEGEFRIRSSKERLNK